MLDRRSFFHPRELARTTGQLLGALEEISSLAKAEASSEEVSLLRTGRRAMATTFEVLLPFGTPRAREIADDALGEIDRLEDQLSVYRDDSEISRLNRLASQAAIPVDKSLFELLSLAQVIHADTDGAHDITAGALVKAWGFYRGPRRVPEHAEIKEALGRVGMEHVELNRADLSVRYRRPLEINLGSIGKGYALDRAAALLRNDWNISVALLHGGRSSVYAMGCQPGDSRGWPIALPHPWDQERRLGMVWLRDRGLGTSAATYRHLEHHGRKLGHILDPRTGWPAEGIASATAIAPTAAEADALATAFFILGLEPTRTFCQEHPGYAAVLLPEGPSQRPLVIGLEAEECTLS